MKPTQCWIYTSSPSGEDYDCQLYVNGDGSKLRVGDVITDSTDKTFNVVSFYNPSAPSVNDQTSLFDGNNGWHVVLHPNGIYTPTTDTGDNPNSSVESLVIPHYGPEVAWRTTISNITAVVPAYHYRASFTIDTPNDAGSGTANVGDMFVDFNGNLFSIVSFNSSGSVFTIADITESGIAPSGNLSGYIYRPKNGAVILSQAKLSQLNATARDTVDNIGNGVLWDNRGIQLTTSDSVIKNVTNIDLQGLTATVDVNPAWNGGVSVQLVGSGGGGGTPDIVDGGVFV